MTLHAGHSTPVTSDKAVHETEASYMEHHSTNSTYAIGGDSVGASTVLSEAATENIGKYGRMRREYLQEYQPEFYNQLLLSGKLQVHLLEINYTAHQRLGRIMRELAKWAGATKRTESQRPT